MSDRALPDLTANVSSDIPESPECLELVQAIAHLNRQGKNLSNALVTTLQVYGCTAKTQMPLVEERKLRS